jgi:hypothetical protein
MPEFSMIEHVTTALAKVWAGNRVNFTYLPHIHQTAISLKFSGEYQHLSMEEKIQELEKTVAVNLGDIKGTLEEQLTYSRKWDKKGKILLINPSRANI